MAATRWTAWASTSAITCSSSTKRAVITGTTSGEGFTNIGRIISERYKQLGEERGDPTTKADESVVGDAIRQATDELDRAFTALGDTLRHGDARDHVRDTGRKLADAVKVTLTEVGDEVLRAVGSRQWDGPNDPPPSDPPDDSGAPA